MTNPILYIYIILVVFSLNATAQLSQIYLNGEPQYINGVNLPWNNFGWDFGHHDRWGNGFNTTWFDDAFRELSDNGVNSVRIWVHCDGRASPNFDSEGYVTGLDNNFLADLEQMLDLAEAHQLMVILTLWSHDMLEDDTNIAGAFAGLHNDLIQNPLKTESYLQNALIPIVEGLKDHCNILAWEIINEPEWGMNVKHGGKTKQVVSKTQMQYFVGKCVQTIREHSDQNITIGSAQTVGNDNGQHTNYWHEREFQKLGFDCHQVYFDFYSVHFYNWMGRSDSPFTQNADTWQLGRPILIAETASDENKLPQGFTPAEQLERTFENNYAGLLFWSYHAEDDLSSWEHCRPALRAFNADFLNDYTYNSDCDVGNNQHHLLICSLYPNPAVDGVNIKMSFEEMDLSFKGKLFNNMGEEVLSFLGSDNNYHIQRGHLANGIYYVVIDIYQEDEVLIQRWTEKIIFAKD